MMVENLVLQGPGKLKLESPVPTARKEYMESLREVRCTRWFGYYLLKSRRDYRWMTQIQIQFHKKSLGINDLRTWW